LDSRWSQAHPPLTTLFFVPWVAGLGMRGAYFGVSLFSLALGGLSAALVIRELAPELPGGLAATLALGFLGWTPVIETLRQGQINLLLAALIVGAWYSLRRGHLVAGGILVGMATGLKFYPGLLLVYFLLRHRSAVVSGCITLAVLLAFSVALTGWHTYTEYFETLPGLTRRYGGHGQNLSLLGVLARSANGQEALVPLVRPVFLTIAAAIVVFSSWLVVRRREQTSARATLDVEFALFVALMPLLSPLAWDHYLVILLVPLAVLGRMVTEAGPSWIRLLGLLALLAVLALDMTSFGALRRSLDTSSHWFWLNWLTFGPTTVALIVLSAWLMKYLWRFVRAPARLSSEPSMRVPLTL
jgi:hypothetical protein